MKILFIGDIMGRTGRSAVFDLLPDLKYEYGVDFCIANGENSSGGIGMNKNAYEELRRAGVDYFTMGNHTWDKQAIVSYMEGCPWLIRPANYTSRAPGRGTGSRSTPWTGSTPPSRRGSWSCRIRIMPLLF